MLSIFNAILYQLFSVWLSFKLTETIFPCWVSKAFKLRLSKLNIIALVYRSKEYARPFHKPQSYWKKLFLPIIILFLPSSRWNIHIFHLFVMVLYTYTWDDTLPSYATILLDWIDAKFILLHSTLTHFFIFTLFVSLYPPVTYILP